MQARMAPVGDMRASTAVEGVICRSMSSELSFDRAGEWPRDCLLGLKSNGRSLNVVIVSDLYGNDASNRWRESVLCSKRPRALESWCKCEKLSNHVRSLMGLEKMQSLLCNR